jgi:hypothetical protein
MLPNMKGTIGIGNLPDAEVDEDPLDIIENLQPSVMLYVEVAGERWVISSDLVYMRLKADITPGDAISSGEAKVRQLLYEVAVLRKLTSWLELGAGGQINGVKSELDVVDNTTGSPVSKSSDFKKAWADPVIVTRVKLLLGGDTFLHFRGNVGGFGVGSELTWQAQAILGYHVTKEVQISAGYRVMGIDYENGSGADRLLYKVTTFGYTVRVGINLDF